MDVAAQSVELGDSDWRVSLALRGFDCGLELWPGVQGVSALTGFNLNKLLNDFKTFQFGEGFELGALRFEAKT